MATTLAACELSGYSKSNHTFLWFSLAGNGFSSSLIKPSSSLKAYKKKTKWYFKLFAQNCHNISTPKYIILFRHTDDQYFGDVKIFTIFFVFFYTQQQHQC